MALGELKGEAAFFFKRILDDVCGHAGQLIPRLARQWWVGSSKSWNPWPSRCPLFSLLLILSLMVIHSYQIFSLGSCHFCLFYDGFQRCDDCSA